MNLEPNIYESMVNQFVTAALQCYPRYTEKDRPFLESIARKQLDASTSQALAAPDFDNLMAFLITVTKASTILGQQSNRRWHNSWLEFRNTFDAGNQLKTALFLNMIIDSYHPDGILGQQAFATVVSADPQEIKTVWDMLCLFPLIIY